MYFSKAKQVENEDLKVELEETKLEVDRIARQSTSEKMFNESEIRDLKNKYIMNVNIRHNYNYYILRLYIFVE